MAAIHSLVAVSRVGMLYFGRDVAREREPSAVRHCDELCPYLSESFKSLMEICLCVSRKIEKNACDRISLRGLLAQSGDFDAHSGDLNKET